MKQANIYAEAEIDGVTYQWLAYRDGDLARVDMHQQQADGSWLRYSGLDEPLFGGTVRGLLEETVSRWLSYSADNGKSVRRTK